MRGHAGRYAEVNDVCMSNTVPSAMAGRQHRPDMDQLQVQLQQILSQQRVRYERDWRPISDCDTTDADSQSIATPSASSRYSAPAMSGMLVKSGSPGCAPDKMTAVTIPSSAQHSTPATSSVVVMRSGQLVPAAMKPSTYTGGCGSVKSGGGGTTVAAMPATASRSSPTTSQLARLVKFFLKNLWLPLCFSTVVLAACDTFFKNVSALSG